MSVTPDDPHREHRGRPGKYPGSPKTVRVRVPEGTEDYVEWCITELPQILHDYRLAARPTRNWVAFDNLIAAMIKSQQLWRNEALIKGFSGYFVPHNEFFMAPFFRRDGTK